MAEQIDHLQPTDPTLDEEFAGIGGWLIVPAFFCVLSPLAGVVSLVAAWSAYSDGLWTEYGEIYSVGVIVVLLGLICGSVYAAILFFGKKSSAPRIIIALILVGM